MGAEQAVLVKAETLPRAGKIRLGCAAGRGVERRNLSLRADGADFVDKAEEPQSSLEYRKQLNSEGSPSQTVSAGYTWGPGTELARKVVNF